MEKKGPYEMEMDKEEDAQIKEEAEAQGWRAVNFKYPLCFFELCKNSLPY